MDGQAEMAPLSADDVAQFLIDNPEADGADDQQEQVPTDESTSTEDTDAPETDDDSPDDADDESDDQPDPTSGRKFKVTVKGEDGADLEQEVDEKNLSAGYQRHADYSRKTAELARREEQAVEVVRARYPRRRTTTCNRRRWHRRWWLVSLDCAAPRRCWSCPAKTLRPMSQNKPGSSRCTA